MAEEQLTQIRQALLNAGGFKRKRVTFNGVTVELREPSVAQRGFLMNRVLAATATGTGDAVASVDLAELDVWSIILCTYVPGTDTPVFTNEDYTKLVNLPASYMDELKAAALELIDIKSLAESFVNRRAQLLAEEADAEHPE